MFNIFILDDQFDDRRERLTKGFDPFWEITVARSYEEAVEIIRSDKKSFDVFMLDHDINSTDKDGHDVVREIIDNPSCAATGFAALFIIHSTNVVGAARMMVTLKEAGYAYTCCRAVISKTDYATLIKCNT